MRCWVILTWLILGRVGGSVVQSRGKETTKEVLTENAQKVGDREAAAAGKTTQITV